VNSKAIADAIAAQFTGITANGETIRVGPTASLPNAITKGPALLVFHPTGTLELLMGPRRRDVLDFPVRLLRDPLDVPNRSDMLYAWYDAMRDRVEKKLTLGLAYVAWAKALTVPQIAIDGHLYATVLWDVVEIVIQVQLDEIVAGVAP
jgi:hypothetical protein